MYDDHEFHRAQVVVALGLNGDPDDVEYIKEMANGDNHYVTQSAISSLAIVGHVKAKDAMIELYEKHRGTARGRLILDLLKKAYKWQPEEI
jgi:HEAT repeat protein